MKANRSLFGALLIAAFLPAGVSAQEVPPDEEVVVEDASPRSGWDVTDTGAPARVVEFETDEGTWMSLDVSPDGRQIVFDLLGNIYTMPVGGGEATLIRGDNAYETAPRYSPDGSRIAFTSDRDGAENLWTMNPDGTDLKQVSSERERQVSTPAWTPDGKYLVGRKHFRNTRSLGAGEMWMYHVGGGNGLQLTDRRNWEQNSAEPEISPDGRYLYYSEDITPGGGFQYNRDPHSGIYAIQRLDLESGESETLIRGPGGAVRPRVSPDGRTVAFVRRIGLRSVLSLYDIESGRQRELFDRLDQDQQEAWAIFGVYPGYAWSPDGAHIFIWAEGKIWRVAVADGGAEVVPFRARVKWSVVDAVRFPQEVAPERFDVKMLRWATVAPDRRSVVYHALGKLWVRALPDGEPRRVTRQDDGWELFPSFSPDGRSLVYTTWSDDGMGAVRTVRLDGSRPARLTTERGHFVEPSWSRDGRHVVYRRVSGDQLRGPYWSRDTGVYIVPSEGGASRKVTGQGANPLFDRSGERIFLSTREEGKAALVSVDLHGGERRVHLLSDNATQITPSPDGRYVALVERFNAYVAPMPATGRAVTIGPNTSSYPIRRITRDAGTELHWTPESDRVYWSLGPELYHRDLAATFAFLSGNGEIREDPDTVGIPIGFQAETDRPTGVVALTGATAITMRGDEVIRDATILVDRNRITQVGPSSEVAIPAEAHRVDLSGRYVIPGLIDIHAHFGTGSNGIAPERHHGYYTNLSFGVTTMHNPSSGTEMVFAASELAKAGLIVAPRLYSTGTILYGAESAAKAIVNEYDDALSHLRRLKAVGAFSVKSYNQPRRDQRQQIVEAARALEMMVVPEGGSTYYWNMSQIIDGHTGLEHNVPVAPLYNDALTLFASSETGYTPTLGVNYGGMSGEYFWYQESNVWEHEHLLRFNPPQSLEGRSRRRQMAAEDDYQYVKVAEAAKALLDRGVSVQIGAHGQLDGLAAHWEIWMFEQGGMTPHEALRAATLDGAAYLGMERDLGSLAPGKLADLVVLERNPLENIRDSESVRYVMLNGRLYDAHTMHEIGNHPRERGPFHWEREDR